MTRKMSPQEKAAHQFADAGWPVFPCQPESKLPATVHGFKDATTKHSRIDRWWNGWGTPRNVAIATGAPGPDVLDVDKHGPRKEDSGYPALSRLIREGLGHYSRRDGPDPERRGTSLLRRDRARAMATWPSSTWISGRRVDMWSRPRARSTARHMKWSARRRCLAAQSNGRRSRISWSHLGPRYGHRPGPAASIQALTGSSALSAARSLATAITASTGQRTS